MSSLRVVWVFPLLTIKRQLIERLERLQLKLLKHENEVNIELNGILFDLSNIDAKDPRRKKSTLR